MRSWSGILGAALLVVSASANASLWQFDYTNGSTLNVGGVLTTSDTLSTVGSNTGYLVTGITGTRNGVAIVGLATPPTLGTYGFDNLLLAGPGSLLDVGGIAFQTLGGTYFNICGASPAFAGFVCGTSGYTEFNTSTGAATAVAFTAHKLPEPATSVLVLAALGAMGFSIRRPKSSKSRALSA